MLPPNKGLKLKIVIYRKKMFKNVILIEMSKCTRLSANLSSWRLYLIDLNIGTEMLMLIIGNTFLKDYKESK